MAAGFGASVLTRNWRLKLAAVAFTVVLWALVREDPSMRGDRFTVPVHTQVGDLGWTLAGDPDPSTVEVRVRGSATDLARIARVGVSLRIPLDSVLGADTLVELRRDWVAIDPGMGVVVEDITPAAVRVRLEPTLSSLVPVRLQTSGELRAGLALAAPVAMNPQFVRVRGAARRVRGLDSVPLLPLELRDVAESGMYYVDVDTTGLGDLTVTPRNASLGIRLEPSVERDLGAVRVIAGPLAAGGPRRPPSRDSVAIEPATVMVRLSGARTPVADTDSAAVLAVVPAEALAGLGPDEERRVPIRLRGVPPLVRGFADADSVTVRRVAKPAGGASRPRAVGQR